jgi:hypothetical protein
MPAAIAFPDSLYPEATTFKSTRPQGRGPRRQVIVAGVEGAATPHRISKPLNSGNAVIPGEHTLRRESQGKVSLSPFIPAAGKPLREAWERSRAATCYFPLAFCAAQRRRWASAIRLRASGLRTRFFLLFPATPGFAALSLPEILPDAASRERTCVSLAISASI